MTGSLNLKSGGEFVIDIRSEGDTVLVKCKGRLVFGQTDILKQGVRDLLPKSRRVVLDLSEVNYMDSAGLGSVVRLYVSAKTSDCELQVVNLTPCVRQLFALTRILSLFEPCGKYNIRIP